jgi:hypothetical protein
MSDALNIVRKTGTTKRRAVRIVAKSHTCEPEYRGTGHAYAYCKQCDRVMSQFSQRAHDTLIAVKQIMSAKLQSEV